MNPGFYMLDHGGNSTEGREDLEQTVFVYFRVMPQPLAVGLAFTVLMALGVKNALLIAGLGRIWQSGSMFFFLNFDLKQIIIVQLVWTSSATDCRKIGISHPEKNIIEERPKYFI